MTYQEEKTEQEALYWREFYRGYNVARDWLEAGVDKNLIRESAYMTMEVMPTDEAYWRGIIYATRPSLLRFLHDLWKKLPTMPKKARSQ